MSRDAAPLSSFPRLLGSRLTGEAQKPMFYEPRRRANKSRQAFAERSEAKVDTSEGAKNQHGCEVLSEAKGEANFLIAKAKPEL